MENAQSEPIQAMETQTFNYTAIYAPVAYFVLGLVGVLLLNRFIGKKQSDETH